MERPSPFIQHFDTNFIPTSSEIDEIQRLMDGRRAMLEAIDAQIAELQRCRESHAQYIKKHGDLISPARRLPCDILLSIFLMLIEISDDRPPSHPAVTVSHVCRQWRVLALDSALLWADIDIRIPSYPNWHLRGVPSHVPQEDEDEYVRGLIGAWQLRVSRLTERIKAFLKRSKGCPLQVSFTARDPAGFEQLANPSVLGSASGWEQVLIPMTCMRSTRDNRWKSLRLDLKMCPIATLLLGPVRLALDGRLEGLESLELDFSYHGTGPLTARMWEALLPSGIDLGRIPLTSLTARMPHSDLCRINARWGCLTTLSIGSPDSIVVFEAEDAISVLTLTLNLAHCTIAFAEGITPTPFNSAGRVLPLRKLTTLVLLGSPVPIGFAALLQLPSLVQLSVMQCSLTAADENTSPIVELIRRYGATLTDVSFVYTSLTQFALEYTLRHLPNVVSLEMVAGDLADAMSIRLNPNHIQPSIHALLDPALVRKLTPKLNEPGQEVADEILCPRLRTLVCELGNGHEGETKRRLMDFVEARRSVPKRNGPVAWLERVDIGFRVGPVDWMVEGLMRKGVDISGVSFTAKYPDERSQPCSVAIPVPGFGTLDLSMALSGFLG